jgi:hypothetical protein
MPLHVQIEQLLREARIWKPGQFSALSCATVPTGWPELDHALGGGWPLGQLTEILVDACGIGEFTLLLPALRRLVEHHPSGRSGWAVLIAPPYTPYAPALVRAGLDLSRLLLVRAAADIDTLWAMEQASHSGVCAAVVGWSDDAAPTPLRRLQLAAEAGAVWMVVFRPSRSAGMRSPAALRIHLARGRTNDHLELNVLRRRNGAPSRVGLRIGGWRAQ